MVHGTNSFKTRIPVQAGDRLGLYGPNSPGTLACTTGSVEDEIGLLRAAAPLGSINTFPPVTKDQVPVSATLEPDKDGDGYGDETQDGCPQSAAYPGRCPTVTFESHATAKKRSILVRVGVSSEALIDVYGQVGWGYKPSPKLKTAGSKPTRLIIALSGPKKTALPGKQVPFRVPLRKAVLRRLGKLTPKESLTAKLTVSCTDLAGQVKHQRLDVKLQVGPGRGSRRLAAAERPQIAAFRDRLTGSPAGTPAAVGSLPARHVLPHSARKSALLTQAQRQFIDRDSPREECGVFGVYAPGHDVSRLAYFSLYALQHRGQESAGIATCEGGHITTLRDSGLVSQVFDEEKLRALEGDMAIGHVRYSTTGGGSWENAQPVWRDDGRELALAHNGNLTNAVELWTELKERGIAFRGTSDSEIIAALLSSHDGKLIEDAVTDVMPRLEGAYSTVVMTKRAIVAFRDPHGVRPLSLGRLDDRFVVASESCAFDIIGAELMREVHPGEMVSLTERGLETRQVVKAERPAMCVFEHIYFSRPDSRMEGRVLQQSRGRMGEILHREAPVDADLVISVPDSGNPAAAGFARASGLPRDDGLIKNRYVARTFIQPGQELRKHGLRLKFNPLPEIVAGKRLVVVDDSIVRGNTTRQIVAMLRDAGASEIHLRISAPPIRPPCHYGVDMSTREEMIAHKRTVQEIADELDADSLAYLSMEGVYEAIGTPPEDHCDACFTGHYPLGNPEEANGKYALEEIAVVPASR